MTRRGYLVTLTMAAAVAAILVTYWALTRPFPPLRTLWEPDPVMAQFGWRGWLYNYFWWILIIALFAQVIDTMLVLRKFAQKEAEERAADTSAAAIQTRPAAPSESQTQVKT